MLYQNFDAMGLDYIKSCTNFIMVNFETSAYDLFVKLRKMGLVTRTIKEYGLPNSLRITVASEEMNQKLIDGLKTVL